MKKQVVHLTSETRRRVLQLYRDLGVLLRQDASSTGLPARSGFCYVRPSLFQMFSHLWGKDDLSLTKVVVVDRRNISTLRLKFLLVLFLSFPTIYPFSYDFR